MTDLCAINSICSNIDGSYDCTCNLGFVGDGRIYCSGNVLPISMYMV